MEDFELYEKIEAYLKGQLAPEDTKAFESEIAQDTDLAERVAQHRFEWDAMEVIIENDLRGKMAQWKADKDTETNPSVPLITSSQTLESADEKKSPLRVERGGTYLRRLSYALAAAASVAVVVAAAWWLWFRDVPKMNQVKPEIVKIDTIKKTEKPTNPINTPPQYPVPKTDDVQLAKKKDNNNELKPEPKQSPLSLENGKTYIALATNAYEKSDAFSYQDEQSSRGNNETGTTLDVAGKAYDKKDYTHAIVLLKNTPVTDENFINLEILAHAYFQSKNYKAALSVFQNLQKLSGKKSRDKSDWYVLLCYLADYKKHKKDFNTLSQKILNNKEHTYFKATTELISHVNQ